MSALIFLCLTTVSPVRSTSLPVVRKICFIRVRYCLLYTSSVVSKSPTMAELIPMYNALLIASEDSCERPPAKRRKAVGLMKRNKAIVLRTFSSLKGFSFSNGVPGIGLSRLIGMDLSLIHISCQQAAVQSTPEAFEYSALRSGELRMESIH